MNTFGTKEGLVTRPPATANLMIDSADRSNGSPWNFQITRNQALANGFFTRIGTTEVVLEWCEENIQGATSTYPATNNIIVDISGTGLVLQQNVTIPAGFYSVEGALDALAAELTDLSGTSGVHFVVTTSPGGQAELVAIGGEFRIEEATWLSEHLTLPETPGLVQSIPIYGCPDLRRYRYLDFVSNQLTYNQNLKDTSSSLNNRDVLCRWYMAWDGEPSYDAYGYPILMGYTKFVTRRIFNPPKQIMWDKIQPIGNLAFEVYGDDGNLVNDGTAGESDWLMTLQLSEN